MNQPEEHDEDLGRELRDLYVPDHRPGFFSGLGPRLEEVAPGHRQRRPEWQRPPVLLGAAAVVVVAVLVVRTLLPGGAPSPAQRSQPPVVRLISANQVRARVSTALASLHTLTGEVTFACTVNTGTCAPPGSGGRTTVQSSFVTDAAGDERVTGVGRTDDLAYVASRGEETTVSGSGQVEAQIATGLPPGPPDFAAPPSVLRRDLGSVVRAFLGTTDEVPVTEVTEQGRPAWRLVTPVVPNKLAGPGGSGDQLEVIVDRQSGFPLRVTETLGGRFLDEFQLSNLVVDGPVDPAAFTLTIPAGLRPSRTDVGFRPVTLAQAAARAGYQPVLPTTASLPPGYHLAETTIAASSQPTGSEGANPPSRRVVSVAYRRGFDRIVVTTRSTGTARACDPAARGTGTTACWADPLSSGEGEVDLPQRFTIAGGALSGAQAAVVISPRGVPHVWTIDSRLVVTVAGDATADELRRMAQSFAPAG